ncbi:MAG: hypothetical protein M9933_09825 [Chitinophagaceae bacterium]|nr:hypothetical protein [Chitinophagaceae bacterium]
MSTGAVTPWTMLEVFKNLPEGTLAQVIKNNLVRAAAPLDQHQRILGEIHFLIGTFVKKKPLRVVRLAAYDVHLDKENVFHPDIILSATKACLRFRKMGYTALPTL